MQSSAPLSQAAGAHVATPLQAHARATPGSCQGRASLPSPGSGSLCPHSVSACKLTDEACFILYEFWQDVTSWRRWDSVRVWGRALGGSRGLSTAPPPCPACPTALPCVPWGHLQLTGGEHPDKGFGEQGLVLGGAEAALSLCVGRGVPAPHPPDPAPCFTATCSPAAARLSSSPSSACWSPRSC